MIRFCSLLLLLCLLPFSANAENTVNIGEWKNLPILHEGRIKPLDSFARVNLKSFSGSEGLSGLSAAEWLAESLFSPETAIDRPIFQIRTPKDFGLEERKGKQYSYAEIAQVIQKHSDTIQGLSETPEEEWAPKQRDLMILYQHFILQTQILRSVTLLLPLNFGDDNNFIGHKNFRAEADKKLQKIIKKKGSDLEKYSPEEKQIALMSYQLQTLESGGINNVLFRVIREKNTDQYQSPWQAEKAEKSPETLEKWGILARAYRDHDQALWDKTITDLQAENPVPKMQTEVIFNALHLLIWAAALYGLSLLLLVIANFIDQKILLRVATISLWGGLAAHILHIAMRIHLLGRPPVATLYESILFVAAVCVAGCAFLSYRQKNTLGVLLGALSGLILLSTANAFAAEDTMGTLVAVLNTNFWLTTHVLCITMGYGWCLIASLLAHIALIKNAGADTLARNIKTLSILALLFTAVGTILGGIWADQSWGRFWGWDPKENGALLIVLWLIWLLHGRISKHITERGFMVGTAFLSVVVVLAWFGVNLLSVGLHSYGFISGIAWGISLFCAFEVILIGGLWGLGRKAVS